MSDDYPHLKYKEEDTLVILSMNRPPVNALGQELIASLEAAIDRVRESHATKALIITSSLQDYFSAGADVKEMANIENVEEAAELMRRGKAFIDRLETMEIPTIAAVNGVCLGGGMELVMACHIRIASEAALFGQPEINLGIIPGFGGTQRLARIVGEAKALELILTGDPIRTKQAEALGLVNLVVPEDSLLKQSKALAWKIAKKGKPAIAAAIRAVVGGLRREFEAGMELETEMFSALAETEDMREGINAFLEKRQPRFKDK